MEAVLCLLVLLLHKKFHLLKELISLTLVSFPSTWVPLLCVLKKKKVLGWLGEPIPVGFFHTVPSASHIDLTQR